MKKILIRLASLTVFMIVSSFLLKAEIRLPSIFGDNMVLQQQANVAIWGKAAYFASVSIKTSWDRNTYTTRAGQDGKWRLKVSTPSAGGPYTLTVSDGKALTLTLRGAERRGAYALLRSATSSAVARSRSR